MCLSIVKHGEVSGEGRCPLPRLILMSYNFFCYKYATCNETFTLQQPQSAQPQQAPHYVRRRRNYLYRLHSSRKILAPLTLRWPTDLHASPKWHFWSSEQFLWRRRWHICKINIFSIFLTIYTTIASHFQLHTRTSQWVYVREIWLSSTLKVKRISQLHLQLRYYSIAFYRVFIDIYFHIYCTWLQSVNWLLKILVDWLIDVYILGIGVIFGIDILFDISYYVVNAIVVIIYLVMASGLTKGKLLAVIGDEVYTQFVL